MINYEDVLEAKKRLEGVVIKTPLLRVPSLDESLGCEVYLKPENLQLTGSFKIRGASNRILAMTEEEKKHGVVCASSGNHAQGVACAAQKLGIDAVIVMPTDCNEVKLNGVKSYGASVILEGTLSSEREICAKKIALDESRILIPPYDDNYVRSGQGTLGLEILKEEPTMDVVVVPIGGGGLISGVATAVKGSKESIRVIGVEPKGARRYGASREKGEVVWLEGVNTIADGTRTDRANKNSFAIIEKLVDDLVAIDDDYIKLAMKEVVSKAKIIAEPSSVLGIAAAMGKKLPVKLNEKVCFVITGGNNDLNQLSEVIKG